MLHLPTPILGNVTAITITSPELENSFAYYNKLGFSLVMRSDWPFPWIQISDGVLLIMLRKDPLPYIAMTYYVKNIDEVVHDLEEKGIKFDQKAKKADLIKRYFFRSPDGLNLSLVSIIDGFSQPQGTSMLRMQQEDYFNPDKYANKTLGMFGEFAHPVTDLDKSLVFWQKLGFSAISKFTTPYPWAIISDGLAVVGLHQTKQFSNPVITYFAADMGAKIAALKKNGLTGYKEESPGNIVLTTPEEQHINLFSLPGSGASQSSEEKKIEQAIIETAKLRLKEITPEILNELFTASTDEKIIGFLGLADAGELATEKSKWQGGYTTYRTTIKQFLLEDKESGKIIGKAGFHNWYALHRRAELGYAMTDESLRGEGYMKEAVKAIIAHGFEHMGLNRIEAFVGTANEPSLRIMKAFGFRKEGTLREYFNNNGRIEDSVCFSLLRREYDAETKLP